MRLWPSPEDRTPQQTRFWVTTTEGPIVPASTGVESVDAVQQRLELEFPLYRVARIGQEVLLSALKRGEV